MATDGARASLSGPRRAAVLGSPVAHSRSPVLHRAAFAALGLDGWTYERIECDAAALPGLVASVGPDWVGFSVTMPGKKAALAVADHRTDRAVLVGSANTLVRTADGWLADNTDVEGVEGALDALGEAAPRAGAEVLLLGAGGTALAVVVALAGRDVGPVVLASRSRERSADVLDCADRVGVDIEWIPLESAEVAAAAAGADLVVNTLPAEAAAARVAAVGGARALLDVLYEPWPTPLVGAVRAGGGAAVGGLTMLLCQAFAQVRYFTGRPAPRAAMAAALAQDAAGWSWP